MGIIEENAERFPRTRLDEKWNALIGVSPELVTMPLI